MRRVLMILTVAALMAAMMVSAGPAQAQGNETNFENSTNCVQGGDEIICGFGDDFGDFFDFGNVDGFGDFFFDDFGVDDGFNDGASLVCFDCDIDFFS